MSDPATTSPEEHPDAHLIRQADVPPLDRRSPSSLRSATRMRSCSILIGSFPAVSGTPFTLRGALPAVSAETAG